MKRDDLIDGITLILLGIAVMYGQDLFAWFLIIVGVRFVLKALMR